MLNLGVHVIMCEWHISISLHSKTLSWTDTYATGRCRLLLLRNCWWTEVLGTFHSCGLCPPVLICGAQLIVEAPRNNHANPPVHNRPAYCLLCQRTALLPPCVPPPVSIPLSHLSPPFRSYPFPYSRLTDPRTPRTGYHARFPSFLPQTADCAGSENAALFGCGLLSSYLGLFIQFFIKTYVIKRPAVAGAGDRAVNGKANGHHM